MYLTKRQRKIIEYLATADNSITGKQLSSLIGVSSRTIRLDINDINRSYPDAIVSFHSGYKLNASFKAQFVFESNNDPSAEAEITNLNSKIIGNILANNKPNNIDELADSLFVSTSTLNRQFTPVREILRNFNLKLIRNKNTVSISGTEYDKRRMICSLIHDDVDSVFLHTENYPEFFEQVNLQQIKTIVSDVIANNGYRIEEMYLMNLIINIGIAFDRIIKGCSEFEFILTNEIPIDEAPYQMSKEICEKIGALYNVTATKNDIDYIACLIMSQTKPIKLHQIINNPRAEISPEFARIVRDILIKVLNYYMLDIDIDEFYMPFLLHVNALVQRVKINEHVNNVYIDSLKINCPFIYEVAVEIAKRFNRAFNIDICDDEIGFIAIHIGYAIEQRHNISKIRTLIINSDYHEINQKIINSLSNKYKNELVIANIVPYATSVSNFNSYDLIITTGKYIHSPNAVCITPFLTNNDLDHIDAKIKEIKKGRNQSRMEELISRYFPQDLFFSNTSFSNAGEVISFQCRSLHKDLSLSSDFKEKILEREAISSTCINQSFAVPHAFNSADTKSAISIVINDVPLDWFGTKIKIVIMLAFCDDDIKDFMEIYNLLISVLINDEAFSKLLNISDYHEFINVLRDSTK